VSAGPEVPFHLLFMGLLCEEKGLYDAIKATVKLAQIVKERGARVRPILRVCGSFSSREDERTFRVLMREANVAAGYELVLLVGFVDGERKRDELRRADCFVFPTFYSAENSPLVLIEAMASGVHVVTTQWRGVPEMLPADYVGLVPPRDSNAVAMAMFASMTASAGRQLREHFVNTFGVRSFTERFVAAIMPVLDAHS
jgi:glycosyltransferase involved in cell wall biosynthesis